MVFISFVLRGGRLTLYTALLLLLLLLHVVARFPGFNRPYCSSRVSPAEVNSLLWIS